MIRRKDKSCAYLQDMQSCGNIITLLCWHGYFGVKDNVIVKRTANAVFQHVQLDFTDIYFQLV